MWKEGMKCGRTERRMEVTVGRMKKNVERVVEGRNETWNEGKTAEDNARTARMTITTARGILPTSPRARITRGDSTGILPTSPRVRNTRGGSTGDPAHLSMCQEHPGVQQSTGGTNLAAHSSLHGMCTLN